ncbi:unnamed protein product, partial [Ranitomeya imitator]
MVYSRQGTTETIEEADDEQEEDGKSPTSRLAPSDEEYCVDLEGSSYTPDTELPLYSTADGDLPPSYSKAVSFEQLSFASHDESADNNLMVLSPDDSHIDKYHDTLLPTLTHELTASELLLNKMFEDEELEDSEKFYTGQPRLLQLIYALYNTLVARSEMVCYFVIILNHMISASIITLVLPILIFLWAMLSVPRPSKRFWMAAIVYTEICISDGLRRMFSCFIRCSPDPLKIVCSAAGDNRQSNFFVYEKTDSDGSVAVHRWLEWKPMGARSVIVIDRKN